jgi:hypothetical protein
LQPNRLWDHGSCGPIHRYDGYRTDIAARISLY